MSGLSWGYPDTGLLYQGDCLEIMSKQESGSLDALITDPPSAISFMNKAWDSDKGGRDQWVSWLTVRLAHALRLLKPGSHALIWALPRTSHWTALAIENAGFEIRDCIYHLNGQGFPKSLNIGKDIDRLMGAERPVISIERTHDIGRNISRDQEIGWTNRQPKYGPGAPHAVTDYKRTAPATDAAKRWDGWGTGLKPAVECWWLARKPLAAPSVARNVLAYGIGGLNIDACRIAGDSWGNRPPRTPNALYGNGEGTNLTPSSANQQGRWPANALLSHSLFCSEAGCDPSCPVAALGEEKAAYFQTFFYAPKASRSERNAGLDGLPDGETHRYGAGIGEGHHPEAPVIEKNTHPTVKSQQLMRWLCRLITPPGGNILDPFAGSGSTCCAAIAEGFHFLAIELDQEYATIASARIEHAMQQAVEDAGGRKA